MRADGAPVEEVVAQMRAIKEAYPDIWEGFVGKRVRHLKSKYAGLVGGAVIACNILTLLLG